MEIFTERKTRDLRVAGNFFVRKRGGSLPGCCSLRWTPASCCPLLRMLRRQPGTLARRPPENHSLRSRHSRAAASPPGSLPPPPAPPPGSPGPATPPPRPPRGTPRIASGPRLRCRGLRRSLSLVPSQQGATGAPHHRKGPARFVANAPACEALIRSAALEGVFASSLDVRYSRTSALALPPRKAPLTPPPAAAARCRPRQRGGRGRLPSLRGGLRGGEPEGAMGGGGPYPSLVPPLESRGDGYPLRTPPVRGSGGAPSDRPSFHLSRSVGTAGARAGRRPRSGSVRAPKGHRADYRACGRFFPGRTGGPGGPRVSGRRAVRLPRTPRISFRRSP